MGIKKFRGDTTREFLIVLVGSAILLLMARPAYNAVMQRVKSYEAKMQLRFISNLQVQYQLQHAKYSASFEDIDFVPPKKVTEGGEARYEYYITEASNTSFKARAEAVEDFDGDGVFNIWEIDESEKPIQIVKD